MIRRIKISNYALIRELNLEPAPGFNIITGETGAGKSIILGALGLLQGKRADVKSVARVDQKSSVEAEVVFPDGRIHVISREILPSGRSKAYVDSQPVSLSELGEIASPLIDIHSQHQNLQLADEAFQRETIDRIAGNQELLDEYGEIYSEYRAAVRLFADTRDEIEKTDADSDYLQFLLNELEEANLGSEEEEELEAARERLTAGAVLSGALSSAASLLTWDDSSVSEKIDEAVVNLRKASETSAEYQPLLERLESLRDELNDIAGEVADEASALNVEPQSLEDVETRLERIYTLKHKHRVDSVAQLLEIKENLSHKIDLIQNSESVLHELEQKARRLKKKALEKAAEISERRQTAAKELAERLCQRARPLGLDNLAVDIKISKGKLNPFGFDLIEFLFAFNKNQTPAPVSGRASGGEISRLMLALKSITVEHSHTPTIIFDEIDTGVSGEVATRMGELMAIISKHIQVITITHLAQVAAGGELQFKVFKHDEEDSTVTEIRLLNEDERRHELALMLSGRAGDTAALATADSLLRAGS